MFAALANFSLDPELAELRPCFYKSKLYQIIDLELVYYLIFLMQRIESIVYDSVSLVI